MAKDQILTNLHQQQQQQQHSSVYLDLENYFSKIEDEIQNSEIEFIKNETKNYQSHVFDAYNCKEEEEEQQQHIWGQLPPVFIDHLVRSPELRLSPLPLENLLAYDRTIQQLYEAQHQPNQQKLVHQQQQVHQQQELQQQQITDHYLGQQKVHEEYKKELFEVKQQHKMIIRQPHIDAVEEDITQQQREKYQCKQMIKKKEEENKREGEDYIKIAVGELINAFEQQAMKNIEEVQQQQTDKHTKLQQQQQQQQQQQDQQKQLQYHRCTGESEELYVPREIPLESYAPPPALPAVLANASSASVERNRATSTSRNAIEQPKESLGATNIWSSPPKQQYLPANCYQKQVQQVGQIQRNFQPAALTQTKLAKFQQNEREIPSLGAKNGGNHGKISPNQRNLANSPLRYALGTNFNNSARGWQAGMGGRGKSPFASSQDTTQFLTGAINRKHETTPWVNYSLPYTDF